MNNAIEWKKNPNIHTIWEGTCGRCNQKSFMLFNRMCEMVTFVPCDCNRFDFSIPLLEGLIDLIKKEPIFNLKQALNELDNEIAVGNINKALLIIADIKSNCL